MTRNQLAAIALLLVLPEWMYGWNINGIVHHSVVSIPLLLLAMPAIHLDVAVIRGVSVGHESAPSPQRQDAAVRVGRHVQGAVGGEGDR